MTDGPGNNHEQPAGHPASPRRSGALRRTLRNPWVGQIVVAAVLVSLAAWQVNLAEVARSFAGVRYGWLGVAVLVYVPARLVNAWEWRILLTKVGRAPILGLFGVLLIGTFVNAVLPGNLGDVAKIQIAANRYSLPRVGLVAGRGAEAAVNGALFVLVVLLSVVVVRGGFALQPLLWLLAAACVVVFPGVVIASRKLPKDVPQWRTMHRLPNRLQAFLEGQWPRFHDGLEVIRRPRLLAVLLLMGIFGWGVDLVINWSYGNAFNLDVPFSAYVSITVLLAVITTFPISFGNVGTWEVGIVGVLALYDVPPDRALAYAVGTHILITCFNLGLGLIAMVLMRVHIREIFRLRTAPQMATEYNPGREPP